jgi:two-component system, OmpR family, alkaline phosphatase synthesis response regulator PhoP
MTTSQKILIVEDDQFLLDLYVEILSSEGFTIEMAKDGEEAYAKMFAGGYDLILLDIMLPKIDGLKIMERLKSETPPQTPNGPIVIISNLDHDSAITKAMALGAKGYMVKSDQTPDQIVKKIKMYLGE